MAVPYGYAKGIPTNTCSGDFDKALVQHAQQMRATGDVFMMPIGSSNVVSLTASKCLVHFVSAEAAIHKTMAQCRELKQVFRCAAISRTLHVQSTANMQEHAQELDLRCDHLKSIKAEVDSAEMMDSDLKAELKQTELELQLKQAWTVKLSHMRQLRGKLSGCWLHTDLPPAALLQEQSNGWRERIQTANTKLNTLRHREKEEK